MLAALAAGDRGVAIPCIERRDEVGDNACAAETCRDHLVRRAAVEAEAAEVRRRESMRSLADGVEQAVGGVVRQVSSSAETLQATARTMSDNVRQSHGCAIAVAAAVEEQGSATAEIARHLPGAASGTQGGHARHHGREPRRTDAGEAAGAVLISAEVVTTQATALQAEVHAFLTEVEAA